jgi:hypothetical protein
MQVSFPELNNITHNRTFVTKCNMNALGDKSFK